MYFIFLVSVVAKKFLGEVGSFDIIWHPFDRLLIGSTDFIEW
jgi:hypothetical protein